MALTPRTHGVAITAAALGAVALFVNPLSVWGIVATAPDAVGLDLNTPILVQDLEATIAATGEAGTASRALRAIADFGRSTGVLILVDEGEGADPEDIAADQAANVIAGLQKLLVAEQAVAVRPRILAAPGLDDAAVTAAMGVVATQLRAMAYARAIGATPAEIYTYRQTYSTRELMLIDGDFNAFDALAEAEVVSFAAARAVGARAWLDREVGYHKTISNVAVPGVLGLTNPRTWDLQSADTEIGLINGADVTGLIRRNGFRFWGNRTCSDDPRYAFESAVRTDQVLRDTIAEGVFPYIDQPLRQSLAIDIIESLNALGRREVLAGRLIGFEAFLAEGNTPEMLAAGKLRIGYRFTPCAPLEELGIGPEITDEFYADFAELAGAA
ncbi:MAG: phage tail sheath subtilisin-like domain-containing protein [Brevundimonas sp.]|uniref:phage tail sheath subtilisin-like domain-containing protein n=1 Tax=Brevundimonas sp. TaxID=1871086 RepID=UPI002ABAA2F8|nr:phage tail sheath subtilisin-like domain-containing protein [Brevundimonas sp.]MDZ4108143.1 phage tail sheath subtilisin-like domain-containing protein [Brevundimonas sp.]